MDEESSLRAFQVSNGERAVGVSLDDLVLELELGVGGIYAYREQALRIAARTRIGDVSVRVLAIAVLEDLDANDEPVSDITGSEARWAAATMSSTNGTGGWSW